MYCSPKIALLIASFVLPGAAVAYSELAEPPSFETLLVSEPVVVIASMTGTARQSSKTFPAQDGENPAYTEEYVHFEFELNEALKGEVPENFEVRQIAGQKGQVRLEPEQEVLMVLNPDVGKDAKGQRRSGYLISFAAHFPVTDDAITVPGASGEEIWSLQKVREKLASSAKAKDRRYEANAETPEAASAPVVSGELERSPPDPELPAAKTDRGSGLTPVEKIEEIRARNADSPGRIPVAAEGDSEPVPEPQADRFQIPPWVWLIGIVALFVVFRLLRR